MTSPKSRHGVMGLPVKDNPKVRIGWMDKPESKMASKARPHQGEEGKISPGTYLHPPRETGYPRADGYLSPSGGQANNNFMARLKCEGKPAAVGGVPGLAVQSSDDKQEDIRQARRQWDGSYQLASEKRDEQQAAGTRTGAWGQKPSEDWAGVGFGLKGHADPPVSSRSQRGSESRGASVPAVVEAQRTRAKIERAGTGMAKWAQKPDIDDARKRGGKRTGYDNTVPEEAFGRVGFRPERNVSALQDPCKALVTPSGRTSPLPTFFVSHGPGAVSLGWSSESPYVRNLEKLFKSNGVRASNVRAIVCFSSHWVSASHQHDIEILRIGEGVRHTLGRDFTGELSSYYEVHSIDYAPNHDAEVAARVRALMVRAGFSVGNNDSAYQCIDSGVWMPLSRMREFKDVAVIQVSLPAHRDTDNNLIADKHNYAELCMQVGYALRPLRSEGILLLGSGNAAPRGAEPAHLDSFMNALKNAMVSRPSQRREQLARWSDFPHSRQIHHGAKPRQLGPLHVVVGAAEEEEVTCTGDFRLANTALANFCLGTAVRR